MSYMLTTGGFVNMAIKTKIFAPASWAPLLGLAIMFSVGGVLYGQNTPPASTLPPRGDDTTRQEVADMDWFLDRHPEIAEQLRKDPSLIDNRRWVADHPVVQEYLQSHPKISEAFRSNPNLFMRDEDRYDRQDRDRDIPRRDIAEMDHFLDGHPEIAEQLRKNPELIDNREWVANHPALQEYLQKHPGVSEEFHTHPVAFMRDEERYDRQDGYSDRDDRNRGELTSFGKFLGGHSSVASELSNDPSLANNKEYLASHPELDEYLKAHPAVSQQLATNPQSVMNSNWVQQGGGFSAKPVGPTKPKSANPNQ
jgi:hypothetical protein